MTQVEGENQAEHTEKTNDGIRPRGFQRCSLLASPSGPGLPQLVGCQQCWGGTAEGPMKPGHLAHRGLSPEAYGLRANGMQPLCGDTPACEEGTYAGPPLGTRLSPPLHQVPLTAQRPGLSPTHPVSRRKKESTAFGKTILLFKKYMIHLTYKKSF